LAISLAYLSGQRKGDLSLSQIASTCLRGGYRRGRGRQHPVKQTDTPLDTSSKNLYIVE